MERNTLINHSPLNNFVIYNSPEILIIRHSVCRNDMVALTNILFIWIFIRSQTRFVSMHFYGWNLYDVWSKIIVSLKFLRTKIFVLC